MTAETSLPATVERAVALAHESVTSCDAALVLVVGGAGAQCVASTDARLAEHVEVHLAKAGLKVGGGFETGEPLYISDLSSETRWPELSDDLVGLGLRSVYEVPLTASGKRIGALVMYSRAVDAFDCEDRETAQLVAVHATAALASSVMQEQLITALSSRTVTGQATGMIMSRYGLDSVRAFEVLRRLSQTQNVKLRQIAERVVETGDIE